jgi:AraC-like DNA-binding protein
MKAYQEHRQYSNSLPLTVINEKDMNFLAHWHTDVEFIFVKSGRIRIGINNDIKLLEKGSLAICSSRDIHFYDSEGMENELTIVIFHSELLDCPGGWPENLTFENKFLTPDLTCVYGMEADTMEVIEKSIDLISSEYAKPSNWSNYIIKSKLYEICGLAIKHLPVYSSDSKEYSQKYFYMERMYKVLNYIDKNYKTNIRLEDAARICNLSPFHFSRTFSRTVGKSFTSYVNSLRINCAEEMLMKDSHTIAHISMECGFESIRTFNRVFKAIKGIPPSFLR